MIRVRATVIVAVIAFAHAVGVSAAPAARAQAVTYQPPVDAPVIDHFREPPHPWGRGNRGIDYGTEPGDVVHAAAPGRVTFVGPVGGTLHVTLLHADGLRTSYSFLASTLATLDQELGRGDPVGVAGGPVHFGVRLGDDYLDPALLFAGELPSPRLLPLDSPLGGAGPGSERAALWTVVVDAAAAGWSTMSQQAAPWLHYQRALTPTGRMAATLLGVARRRREQRHCTSADSVVAAPEERRVVVLVAGLGSSSGSGAIDDLDVEALGYAPEDVVRFSYRGGQVTGDSAGDRRWGSAFPNLIHSRYGPQDTEGDLRVAGRRLLELLTAVSVEAPGVPVDVIAHSQGGIVARIALDEAQRSSGFPAAIDNVITLATPHTGADLATAAVAIGADREGASALDEATRRAGVELDLSAVSVRQLAETSALVGDLSGAEVPDGVTALSIAARGDLMVPVPRTAWPGARRSVVSLGGLNDHSNLPGSAAAQREIALALAGAPPSCESLLDTVADVATGEVVSWAEDLLGADLALTARAAR